MAQQKEKDELPRRQKSAFMASAGLFAGLLLTLGILLWQLPQIASYDLGAPVFIVYVLVSLLAAGIIFGVLRGYGTVKGKKFGAAIEFGGAAAMCLCVLFAGMHFENKKSDVFEITVYLIGDDDKKTLIKVPGTAALLLDEPKNVSFAEGHAIFSKIPAKNLGENISLSVEVNGYEARPLKNIKFKRSKRIYVVLKAVNVTKPVIPADAKPAIQGDPTNSALPAAHAPGKVIQETATELRLKFRVRDGTAAVSLYSPDMDLDTDRRPFIDPLALAEEQKTLENLRWYLENYWRWPVGPDVLRARRAEQGLEKAGRKLFDAVFGFPDGIRIWQQFRDREGAKLLTIDSRDPEILRLPWELLADEKSHLFALDISVRRRVHESKQRLTGPAFKPPLRILMVTARPEDPATPFIDPRLSAKALLDAADVLGPEQAVVEFLAPATFKALSRRLRQGKPVHVVHFDGHGVYKAAENLGYLAFENERGGLDNVDAARLGLLMVKAKTPLLVLDACQSAKVGGPDPFRGVAPRLIEAGAGGVVAMPYSVLTKTAERFFREFYRALVRGDTIGQAVDKGRWALLDTPKRGEIHHPDLGKIDILLKDWFLPVLYQRAGDPAPFAKADETPPQQAERGCKENSPQVDAALLGAFPKPKYCFIGRARELWQLQRHLDKHKIVVVHGLAGQGKTALAAETARWLVRSGRFDKAVFISFEGGGDTDSALGQLGRALLGDDFSALSRADRLPALRKILDRERVLIIWDNFESVLPGWEAQQAEPVLKDLLETGLKLARGKARLLITSRDPKLAPHHYGYGASSNVAYLPLSGMAVSEALELAGSVLDSRGLPRPPRAGLKKLLEYLGGHPLSILLVLPHLQAHGNDVERVIRRFEALYPGFTDGLARKRNRSLELSLQFSLDRLSPVSLNHLPVLGAFAQGALDFSVRNVGQLSETWGTQGKTLIAELEQAGLLSVKQAPVSLGALQFIFGEEEPPREAFQDKRSVDFYRFHPTLAPYVRSQWDEAQRQLYEARHQRFYYALANRLYYLDDRDPHAARALAQRELPNMRRALDAMLAAKEADAVDFASSVERFLGNFGRWRERDVLLVKVQQAFGEQGEGPVSKAQFLAVGGRGKQLLDQGRPQEAEQVFRRLLRRMEQGMAYEGLEAGYDRALSLGRLGRSLEYQGHAGEAARVYRQALAALGQLDQKNRNVRQQIGMAHTDLADVLTDSGRYDEAREQYEKGLAITEELGHTRNAAVSNGQLGTLAMLQKDYAEARRRYRTALQAFQKMNEPRSAAVLYHQLARVAEEESKSADGEAKQALLREAEENYRQSLRLSESFGDYAGAAKSANQLAIVAVYAGRYGDAERWYKKAIELGKKFGSQKELAANYNNFADLLKDLHRLPPEQRSDAFAGRDLLAEAEDQARKAVRIVEKLNDPSLEIWKTYNILADIATAQAEQPGVDAGQAEQQREQARQWRRKERAAFAAFPGAWTQVPRTAKRIAGLMEQVLAGDEEARGAIGEELDKLGEAKRANLSQALRAVLAGAKNADELADKHDLDFVDYLILTKVLADKP